MIGSTPRETLRALVQVCANSVTIWEGNPVPFIPPGPTVPSPGTTAGRSMVYLTVTSSVSKGSEEYRSTYNVDTEELEYEISDYRLFLVTARCESYGADIAAYEILERLRSRLRRRSSGDALRAQNMALVGVNTVVDLPLVKDTRAVSYAAFDFRVAMATSEADTGQDGNWIETAEIEDETIL